MAPSIEAVLNKFLTGYVEPASREQIRQGVHQETEAAESLVTQARREEEQRLRQEGIAALTAGDYTRAQEYINQAAGLSQALKTPRTPEEIAKEEELKVQSRSGELRGVFARVTGYLGKELQEHGFNFEIPEFSEMAGVKAIFPEKPVADEIAHPETISPEKSHLKKEKYVTYVGPALVGEILTQIKAGVVDLPAREDSILAPEYRTEKDRKGAVKYGTEIRRVFILAIEEKARKLGLETAGEVFIDINDISFKYPSDHNSWQKVQEMVLEDYADETIEKFIGHFQMRERKAKAQPEKKTVEADKKENSPKKEAGLAGGEKKERPSGAVKDPSIEKYLHLPPNLSDAIIMKMVVGLTWKDLGNIEERVLAGSLSFDKVMEIANKFLGNTDPVASVKEKGYWKDEDYLALDQDGKNALIKSCEAKAEEAKEQASFYDVPDITVVEMTKDKERIARAAIKQVIRSTLKNPETANADNRQEGKALALLRSIMEDVARLGIRPIKTAQSIEEIIFDSTSFVIDCSDHLVGNGTVSALR